ncbi:MAG: hypothetical protein A2V88_00435 [Elusimicrobia bacterium RBG_16_66_12]|nr:MAG: hypothetical protein A2V88_00435 [Elusimicrobia bacterium RBG_16_66_12]
MLYEIDATAPANTAASAPVEVAARLNKGVITQVGVQIPQGCMGLARAQVWRGGHQLWPTTPGAYFKGDGAVIEWPEDYELTDEPLSLTLRVWNIDDTYNHTLTFRFSTITLQAAEEGRGIPTILRRLAGFLLGRSTP